MSRTSVFFLALTCSLGTGAVAQTYGPPGAAIPNTSAPYYGSPTSPTPYVAPPLYTSPTMPETYRQSPREEEDWRVNRDRQDWRTRTWRDTDRDWRDNTWRDRGWRKREDDISKATQQPEEEDTRPECADRNRSRRPLDCDNRAKPRQEKDSAANHSTSSAAEVPRTPPRLPAKPEKAPEPGPARH